MFKKHVINPRFTFRLTMNSACRAKKSDGREMVITQNAGIGTGGISACGSSMEM